MTIDREEHLRRQIWERFGTQIPAGWTLEQMEAHLALLESGGMEAPRRGAPDPMPPDLSDLIPFGPDPAVGERDLPQETQRLRPEILANLARQRLGTPRDVERSPMAGSPIDRPPLPERDPRAARQHAPPVAADLVHAGATPDVARTAATLMRDDLTRYGASRMDMSARRWSQHSDAARVRMLSGRPLTEAIDPFAKATKIKEQIGEGRFMLPGQKHTWDIQQAIGATVWPIDPETGTFTPGTADVSQLMKRIKQQTGTYQQVFFSGKDIVEAPFLAGPESRMPERGQILQAMIFPGVPLLPEGMAMVGKHLGQAMNLRYIREEIPEGVDLKMVEPGTKWGYREKPRLYEGHAGIDPSDWDWHQVVSIHLGEHPDPDVGGMLLEAEIARGIGVERGVALSFGQAKHFGVGADLGEGIDVVLPGAMRDIYAHSFGVAATMTPSEFEGLTGQPMPKVFSEAAKMIRPYMTGEKAPEYDPGAVGPFRGGEFTLKGTPLAEERYQELKQHGYIEGRGEWDPMQDLYHADVKAWGIQTPLFMQAAREGAWEHKRPFIGMHTLSHFQRYNPEMYRQFMREGLPDLERRTRVAQAHLESEAVFGRGEERELLEGTMLTAEKMAPLYVMAEQRALEAAQRVGFEGGAVTELPRGFLSHALLESIPEEWGPFLHTPEGVTMPHPSHLPHMPWQWEEATAPHVPDQPDKPGSPSPRWLMGEYLAGLGEDPQTRHDLAEQYMEGMGGVTGTREFAKKLFGLHPRSLWGGPAVASYAQEAHEAYLPTRIAAMASGIPLEGPKYEEFRETFEGGEVFPVATFREPTVMGEAAARLTLHGKWIGEHPDPMYRGLDAPVLAHEAAVAMGGDWDKDDYYLARAWGMNLPEARWVKEQMQQFPEHPAGEHGRYLGKLAGGPRSLEDLQERMAAMGVQDVSPEQFQDIVTEQIKLGPQMGIGFNLQRELAWAAQFPEARRAGETVGATAYQEAVDKQKWEGAVAAIADMRNWGRGAISGTMEGMAATGINVSLGLVESGVLDVRQAAALYAPESQVAGVQQAFEAFRGGATSTAKLAAAEQIMAMQEAFPGGRTAWAEQSAMLGAVAGRASLQRELGGEPGLSPELTQMGWAMFGGAMLGEHGRWPGPEKEPVSSLSDRLFAMERIIDVVGEEHTPAVARLIGRGELSSGMSIHDAKRMLMKEDPGEEEPFPGFYRDIEEHFGTEEDHVRRVRALYKERYGHDLPESSLRGASPPPPGEPPGPPSPPGEEWEPGRPAAGWQGWGPYLTTTDKGGLQIRYPQASAPEVGRAYEQIRYAIDPWEEQIRPALRGEAEWTPGLKSQTKRMISAARKLESFAYAPEAEKMVVEEQLTPQVRGGIEMLMGWGGAAPVEGWSLIKMAEEQLYQLDVDRDLGIGAHAFQAPTPDMLAFLNVATAEQLQQVPGIGPARAQRIMAQRRSLQNLTGVGGFTDIEQAFTAAGRASPVPLGQEQIAGMMAGIGQEATWMMAGGQERIEGILGTLGTTPVTSQTYPAMARAWAQIQPNLRMAMPFMSPEHFQQMAAIEMEFAGHKKGAIDTELSAELTAIGATFGDLNSVVDLTTQRFQEAAQALDGFNERIERGETLSKAEQWQLKRMGDLAGRVMGLPADMVDPEVAAQARRVPLIAKKQEMLRWHEDTAEAMAEGGRMDKLGWSMKRMMVGFAPFQMRRAWQMLGGQVFSQMIPAAAQAEALAWQAAQDVGGFIPGLPEGVAGDVMRMRARQAQAQVVAGGIAHRTWGGFMGGRMEQVIPTAQAFAGPAAGAGLVTALAGMFSGVLAPMAALKLGGGVALAGTVLGAGQYLQSYGVESIENQLALSQGGRWAQMRGAAGRVLDEHGVLGTLGFMMPQRWAAGGAGPWDVLPTALGAGEWVREQRGLGLALEDRALSEMTGQERASILSNLADQLLEDEDLIYSGLGDRGTVLQRLQPFMSLTREFEGMRLEDVREVLSQPEHWITRAVTMGLEPEPYFRGALSLGMGIGGAQQLITAAPSARLDRMQYEQYMGQLQPFRAVTPSLVGRDPVDILRDLTTQRPLITPETVGGTPAAAALAERGLMPGIRRMMDLGLDPGMYAQLAEGMLMGPGGAEQLMRVVSDEPYHRQMQATAYQQWAPMAARYGFEAVPQMVQAGLLQPTEGFAAFQLAGMLGGDQRLWSEFAREGGVFPGTGVTLPAMPHLVTQGPGGLTIGTAAPIYHPGRMTLGQWQHRMTGADALLEQARHSGVYRDLGWGLDTTWGIQDAMTAQQRQYQDITFGIQGAQAAAQRRYLGQLWPIQDQMIALSHAQMVGGTVGGFGFTGQFAFQRQQLDMQLGFAMAGAGLSRRELGLSREQFDLQRGFRLRDFDLQREEMGIQWDQIMTRRGWQQEDWGWQRGRMGREFGWRMEDYEESIRFATGRQRTQLLREQERDVIRYAEDTTRFETERERQEEMWRWEDEAHERRKDRLNEQMDREEQLADIQLRRFDLQEERIGLQEAQAIASHALAMAQLEEQEEAYMQQYELDRQQRELTREHQLEMLSLQEAAAGAAKAHADAMRRLEDKYRDVQRAQEDQIHGWERAMVGALYEVIRSLDEEAAARWKEQYGSLLHPTGVRPTPPAPPGDRDIVR